MMSLKELNAELVSIKKSFKTCTEESSKKEQEEKAKQVSEEIEVHEKILTSVNEIFNTNMQNGTKETKEEEGTTRDYWIEKLAHIILEVKGEHFNKDVKAIAQQFTEVCLLFF